MTMDTSIWQYLMETKVKKHGKIIFSQYPIYQLYVVILTCCWNMQVGMCSPCRVVGCPLGTVYSLAPTWCQNSLLMKAYPSDGGEPGSVCPSCCNYLELAYQTHSSTCLHSHSSQYLLYFHSCSHKPHMNCMS